MRLCCDAEGNIAIGADTDFEMQWLYRLRGALHGDVEVCRDNGWVGARMLRISPTSDQKEPPANSAGVARELSTANTARGEICPHWKNDLRSWCGGTMSGCDCSGKLSPVA